VQARALRHGNLEFIDTAVPLPPPPPSTWAAAAWVTTVQAWRVLATPRLPAVLSDTAPTPSTSALGLTGGAPLQERLPSLAEQRLLNEDDAPLVEGDAPLVDVAANANGDAPLLLEAGAPPLLDGAAPHDTGDAPLLLENGAPLLDDAAPHMGDVPLPLVFEAPPPSLLLVFDTPPPFEDAAPRVSAYVLALEPVKSLLVSDAYFDAAQPLLSRQALRGAQAPPRPAPRGVRADAPKRPEAAAPPSQAAPPRGACSNASQRLQETSTPSTTPS